MAKLHRAKDGHYYVKAQFPGQGTVTYSIVEDEAVAYLSANGVDVDDYFPNQMLAALREKKLIGTKGEGVSASAEPMLTPAFVPPVGRDPEALPLRLELGEAGEWQLSLLAPTLPDQACAEVVARNRMEVLRQFGIQVQGRRVQAFDLWPSHGGHTIPVHPVEQAYGVVTWGPWPASIDTTRWTVGARALNPSGTLFAVPSDGGMQLPPGSAVEEGATYLLMHRSPKAAPPLSMAPLSRGRCRSWLVTEVTVPSHPDLSVENWLLKLGHLVRPAAWSIRIVSPPDRLRIDRAPCFTPDRLILARIVPPPERAGSSVTVSVHFGGTQNPVRLDKVTGPTYLALTPESAGDGIVTVDGESDFGRAYFSVSGQVAIPTREPVALRVVLDPPEDVLEILSSWDVGVQSVVASSRPGEATTASVSVEPGVPLVVHFGARRDISGRRDAGSPSPADQLDEWLAGRGPHAADRSITLDAGAFGSVSLRRADPVILPAGQSAAIPVSPRSRWIAMISPSFRRAGRRMPLDAASTARGHGIDRRTATTTLLD